MPKDECVNSLKYMAAYKYLSLLNMRRHGLKDATSAQTEQFVTVEEQQFRAIKAALFYMTGEHFDTDELDKAEAAQRLKPV
jgi:hypothetical protein